MKGKGRLQGSLKVVVGTQECSKMVEAEGKTIWGPKVQSLSSHSHGVLLFVSINEKNLKKKKYVESTIDYKYNRMLLDHYLY